MINPESRPVFEPPRPAAGRPRPVRLGACVLACWLAAGAVVARAEVIEEIVAWVNDDIITRSDLEGRDREVAAELLSRLSGEELDRRIAEARVVLLRDMISEKLLVQQAERLYDMKKMEESLVKNFKEQEKITTDEELEKILGNEGLTVEDLKRRLMEFNAPRSVVEYEVRDKVSVTDAQVEAYYQEHQSDFALSEQVSFREIVVLSEGRGEEGAMARARELLEKARAGEDFATVARESSEAASREQGGLLGPFKRGELSPEIEAAAFSLPVGQVSDPIRTVHGVHLLRVESHEQGRVLPLDELREKIADQLELAQFQESLQSYLRKLWSSADIEVAQPYLDRISTEWKSLVKTAQETTTIPGLPQPRP